MLPCGVAIVCPESNTAQLRKDDPDMGRQGTEYAFFTEVETGPANAAGHRFRVVPDPNSAIVNRNWVIHLDTFTQIHDCVSVVGCCCGR